MLFLPLKELVTEMKLSNMYLLNYFFVFKAIYINFHDLKILCIMINAVYNATPTKNQEKSRTTGPV